MNQEKESNYNPLLKYLDKIFLAITLLYLGLVLYWIYQPKPSQPDSLVQVKQQRSSVSNSQFIAYLKQSLKVIEAKPLQTPSPPQNRGIEKVYIPVPPKPVKITSIPVPPKPVKITSIPVPPKPVKVTSIPVPPKPVKVTSIPPQADIMLIGVLESEVNSAALFSFKGSTKRLQTGELIGSSGWVFQGVTQQKAILSKGGQTRYIEVGQKF